jgi:hypothetical protein
MTRTTTAVADIAAVFLQCPYCGEPLECPSTGSFMLTRESVEQLGLVGGERRQCERGCGRFYRIPMRVDRVV